MIERADSPALTPRRSPGPLIQQVIKDLHAVGRVATRSLLVEVTGLSYTLIDDHCKRFLERGEIRRLSPGVFEWIEPMPEARAVTCTRLPSGLLKLEIGDQVLDLVPAEARMVGQMLSSDARESAAIGAVRDLADDIAGLRRQLGRQPPAHGGETPSEGSTT